jgi:homopolymeric O-antigen transport system ATP-binding protein
MSKTVIIVENLSKSYVVGHESVQRERYTALRDVVAREARNFVRKASDVLHGRQIVEGDEVEEFWALKNVSFQVKEGEVLGIIGRNGAGKSTLLKILSRITEPSEGRVTIRGRVASLLEVGTGFHPELTGRENIFLNGAILGMTRAELRHKFDQIVAFAEVERFVDTPVKRYSSGMYVRLAFSVAAHLEADILVVDEVLAVGDADFQKKCLGKMSEVAGAGRTVVFVSHNMEAIRRICLAGLFLSAGRVELKGSVDQCIESYLSKSLHCHQAHEFQFPKKGLDTPHIVRIEILDKAGRPLPQPRTWDFVKFRIFFHSPIRISRGSVALYIYTLEGSLLTLCSTSPDSAYPMSIEPGVNFVDCDFPQLMLSAGSFVIGAGLAIPNIEWLDNQPHAATFEVYARDTFGSGWAPVATRYPVAMDHCWHIPKPGELSSQVADPEMPQLLAE